MTHQPIQVFDTLQFPFESDTIPHVVEMSINN